MATREKPPREWDVEMLLDLGEKEGVKGKHLKAVPVLILKQWVQKGKEEGVANCFNTYKIADFLQNTRLASFKPKGRGIVLSALTRMQAARNLTRPRLIEYRKEGEYFWVNLPHYESLLQDYRRRYCKDYPEDYKKLFPHGEPVWEEPAQVPAECGEAKPFHAISEAQNEIDSLLTPVEQALRDRQQVIAGRTLWATQNNPEVRIKKEKLTKENQKLQADLIALQAAFQKENAGPHRKIVDEELRNDCAEFLKKEDTFVDSIRRAGVVLEERLKKAIGGDGPEKFKQGVDLVDYALRKDSGRLIISEYPAEQDGVHMLYRGAVQFVRNPPSHKKMLYSEVEAEQAIGLIDYLLMLLRQAKPRKTGGGPSDTSFR